MDLIAIKCFGTVRLRTWFVPDGDDLVCIGEKREYDGEGKLISVSYSATGARLIGGAKIAGAA